VIPVLDLLNNQAVHARGGEREKYRPVQSVLCSTSDPAALARAFRDRLALRELYVADLDAIQGSPRAAHRDLAAQLARCEGMDLMVDAGIAGIAQAEEWLGLGACKVVIGSETLGDTALIRSLPAALDPARMVFSLDLASGKVLSLSARLKATPPAEVLGELESSGWREVILLELGRVGTGKGANLSFAAQARARFPGLNLLLGGGVSGAAELRRIKDLGLAGALVGTALHSGALALCQIAGL